MDDFSDRLFIGNLLKGFRKPPRLTSREWAEINRFLTNEVTSRPGKMDCMETPWMLYVMECLDNPLIPVIVGRKSAQIAWTETINNYIGKTIDTDPRNIMIAFARDASAMKYYKEKLEPYLKTTPTLLSKVQAPSLNKVSHKHIPFEGCFLILTNAGAAADTKSSVIPIIIVEEPDDVKKDVNKQGDGLKLLQQRQKSFSDGKLIYGGTPTDKEFSQVDRAFNKSNKGFYQVCCVYCSNLHSLSFDNLKADPFQDRKIDEVYGIYNPKTAYYECPYCKAMWDDKDKKKAVVEGLNFNNLGWKFEKPEITDIYGFAFNELLSSFEASSLTNLAKIKFEAETAYSFGLEGLMKSFVNNSKGEAYSPLTGGMTVEELKALRLNYPEHVVPYEGLILTAGIDVQHNRFAIVVRAWGRNDNSWAVYWGEIFGNVTDYSESVWQQLSDFINQDWKHAAGHGKTVKISAATIDCADGKVTELVYRWVLDMSKTHPHIFAARGLDDTKYTNYEIYNEPNLMEQGSDVQVRKNLAQTMGINVFNIGAHRAHEEVLRRFNLTGNRDRYYHCEFSYGGYEEGILSCRKPFANGEERVGFRLIPGRRKEAIDCEKMALHAHHAIQIQHYTNRHWTAIEAHLHNITEKSYG